MSIPNSKIFSKINLAHAKTKAIENRAAADGQTAITGAWGGSLSKQKPTRSLKGRQVGFAHLYYRCIACSYYAKFGAKAASNAYVAPYAKNAHFRSGGSARFLLVEAPPQSPVSKKLF